MDETHIKEIKDSILKDLKRKNRKRLVIVLSIIIVAVSSVYLFFTFPRVIYKIDGEEAYVAGVVHGMETLEIKDTYFGKPVTRIDGYLDENYYSFSNKMRSNGWAKNNRSAISEVSINESLMKISDGSLANIDTLSHVDFPSQSQLEYIGKYAFSGNAIDSIEIPKNVMEIGSYAFSPYLYHHNQDYPISNSIQSSKLTTVTFEEGSKLETIGDSAFESLQLKSIEIPENVTKIETNAFGENEHLTSVSFADESKLKTIGSSAFRGSQIEDIEIPSNVIEIGSNAFAPSRPSIGSAEFDSTEDTSLATVTFEDESKLKTIGSSAFFGAQIESIEIPSSVNKIDKLAFSNNDLLKTVIFEEESKLETIKSGAFSKNESLEHIIIPMSVIFMEGAFSGNSSMMIYVETEEKPSGWEEGWNYNNVTNEYHSVLWGYEAD